ncbi:hypothetical protein P3X46_009584 [Hevea brasiliensis]|uniref:Mitochondrial import inner membrane translocase subunit TIM50 n=1 Tax=Hevea brasiliensis TaxID=3981 RepID=A0ABQ9MMG6_HEVBR|nr:hypothetical protein P3X46_009584 [Hevea brasiliensis]
MAGNFGRKFEEDGGHLKGNLLEKPILTTPRKKLLVLSLDGLLCHRVCYTLPVSLNIALLMLPMAAFSVNDLVSEEFLRFYFERFEVGIWSSAREIVFILRYCISVWYLNNALDCVTRGLRSLLLFSWDQGQCNKSEFNTIEKKDKPIFLKELNKLWENELWKGRYTSVNTLLIDDEPYKALLNPPHTAIFPTEYKANHVNETASDKHPEWGYYSIIISHHTRG